MKRILTLPHKNAIFHESFNHIRAALFYHIVKYNAMKDIETLENELKRVQKELSVLYEVSNAMRSTLELNNILYIILTGVTSHTGLGFNRAILFLLDKMKKNLVPKMAIGPESGEHAHKIWGYIIDSNQKINDLIESAKIESNSKESKFFLSIKNQKFPLYDNDKSLLKEAFFVGMPLHLKDENMEKYKNDPLFNFFQSKELVIMPLKERDKVNGIIVADNLYTQKPITSDDLKIFQMLSNQAGLAIENSSLYEKVIEQSQTDSLTGLWNHGYFQSKMSSEFATAKIIHQPLSLLIIDIDNFKSLNDSYGHQYGDIILKEIAIILKNSSRDNDYMCRYGGEEFSIILSETSKEQGYAIAERIRKQVNIHKYPKTLQGNVVHMTISIGIATFPEDADCKEDLITQADKAMYKAKFSGKNQTYAA